MDSPIPPNITEQKFIDLCNAQEILHGQVELTNRYAVNRTAVFLRRFLATGTPRTIVRTGELNDGKLIRIFTECNGTLYLRILAEAATPHPCHRIYHVVYMARLCRFNLDDGLQPPFVNYFHALTEALMDLFPIVVVTPSDLSSFLFFTANYRTVRRHKEIIATWFTKRSSEELRTIIKTWQLERGFHYREVWDSVREVIEDVEINEGVENVLNDTGEIVMMRHIDMLSPTGVFPHLSNHEVAENLSTRDWRRISEAMANQWENTSYLEVEWIREESKNFIRNDDFDSYFRSVQILLTPPPFVSKIIIIPFTRIEESRRIGGMPWTTQIVAEHFLADLLRMPRALVVCKGEGQQMALIERGDMIEMKTSYQKLIADIPDCPQDIFWEIPEKYDSIVILALTGVRIPYEEIMNHFQRVRRLNSNAKIIFVGVDYLQEHIFVTLQQNTLMISGVNRGTMKTVWDFIQ
uniref:F-box domain-containing protein n=1 Tax=Caenorhabditis tropicalis TaxID=1561998 RepID=A0A1I7U660_9PELO